MKTQIKVNMNANTLLLLTLMGWSGATFAGGNSDASDAMVAKNAMNDISFETGRWLFPANAQFDEHAGTLTLTGQKGQYHRATIKIPVDRTQREVFFSGDLYLEDIVLGDKLWDAPKLRIADGNGKSLKACNLRNSLENQWHIDSCSVDQFHTLGLDELTLEIGFQNSEGRFSVRLPAFSYQRPEASPYVFPYPVPEDTSVTLTLSSEAVVAFENDLLSSNSHFSWADYSWSDAVVRDAIKTHFPMTNMRFPGGTVGNYYDHRTDGYHDDPSTFQSPSREKAFLAGWRFGYPGYQSLVKEQNATATLMFNVMHDDVTATENRLKKRLNDQLPIKWIELGNENYFPAQAYGYSSNGPNNPDVNQYIKHTQSLTQAIRKIAPDIKIAANINHLSYDVGSWSETLSRETYYDATIMHNYISVWNSDLTLSSGKTLIDAYKKTRHNIAEYRETFGNTPVLISEWGVQEAPESFLSVLAYADVFMALLEGNIHDGVVQQAGIHMLYHSDSNQAQSLMYTQGKQTYITPTGIMYAKLFDVFKDADVFTTSSVAAELAPNLPGVIAKAVNGKDTVTVFVVNKLPVESTVNITLDDLPLADEYTIDTYSQDIHSGWPTAVTDPEQAWQRTTAHQTDGVRVPAYSLSVITLQKEDTDAVKAPVIVGVADSEIALNSVFDPLAGISAQDGHGQDITDKLRVVGNVNTQVAGRYTLRYVVENNGLTSEKVRIVTVKAASGEYPLYVAGTPYQAGDKVLASDGHVYQCKPWPVTSWCALSQYAPGSSAYWSDAWDDLELADGQEPPVNPDPPGEGACPAYDVNGNYAAGDVVSHQGDNYTCNVAGWCSLGGAYIPGTGWAWEHAWQAGGECPR